MDSIIVKVNNATQTVAEHQVVVKDGTPTIIKAPGNVNYELVNQATGLAPQHIVTKRKGKDLVVSFDKEGQDSDLVIEGYFNDDDSALIGLAEDGQYYYYIPDTGEISDFVTELADGDIEGQALGGNPQIAPWWAGQEDTGYGILPWLVGLAGLGALAAALNDDDDEVVKPNAPTKVEIGNGDDFITADEIDADGKVDVTVGLPKDAKAGDTVSVNGVDKKLTEDDIKTGETKIKVPAPAEGEKLDAKAIIKNQDGGVSDPAIDSATKDTTAPSKPDSVEIGNGDDFITADEIDADGKVDVKVDLPADAKAGDKVIVNGEEKELSEDDIKAGKVTVKVPAPAEGGKLDVEVTIKDPAGNTSEPATNSATKDTTAPSKPDSVEIGNGDDFITADEIDANGKVDVKVGLPKDAKAGDTVSVNGVDKKLTEDDIKAGEVTVKVPAPAEGEKLDVEVTIKDPAGNTSEPATDSATTDTTAPSKPDSVEIGNGDGFITADEIDANGKVDVKVGLPKDAKAGDTVSVNGVDKKLTEDDIKAGEVTVKVPAPAEGEKLDVEVTIKDPAGNTSEPATDSATTDTTAPSKPDSVEIGNGDDFITADEIDADGKVNVKVDLPADAKADDKVIVNGEEKKLTEDDIKAGEVTVKVPAPAEGEKLDVKATIKDPAGNTSEPATDSATTDTSNPDAPKVSIQSDTNNNGYLSAEEIDGKTEADVKITVPTTAEIGDVLTVTDQNGKDLGSFTVGTGVVAGGSIIVKADIPAEGKTLEVTATLKDSAGNKTEGSDSAMVDTTAPATAPTIKITDDADNNGYLKAAEVEGKDKATVEVGIPADAQAGDVVTVTDQDGNKLAKKTVGNDVVAGETLTVEATIPANGKTLEVTASLADPAGNTVEATDSAKVDTSIPGDVDGDGSVKDPKNPDNPDTDDSDDTTINGAPIISFPEDKNNDGTLNAKENGTTKDTTPVKISLPKNTADGDTVVLTINDGTAKEVPVTAADLTNGFVVVDVAIPKDSEGKADDIAVKAFVKDPAGNQSNTAGKTLAVDLKIPGDVDKDGDTDDKDDDATTVDGAPIVTFPEDVAGNDDGVLNTTENGSTPDKTPVRVSLPANTEKGDTVVLDINGTKQEIPVKDTDITKGYVEVEATIDASTSQIDVKAKVKDPAGNESNEGNGKLTISLTDPDAPTVVITDDVDNNKFLNADELAGKTKVAVDVSVPDTVKVGDVLTVEDQAGNVLGSFTVGTDITVGGKVTVQATVPVEDETLTVTATLEDSAGNKTQGTDSAKVDTTAPVTAPTITITDDGNDDGLLNIKEVGTKHKATVEVGIPADAQDGDVVTVTDQDGNELAEKTVGTDVVAGETLTVEATIPANGETLKVTASLADPAGNTNTETDKAIIDLTAPSSPAIQILSKNEDFNGRIELKGGATITSSEAPDTLIMNFTYTDETKGIGTVHEASVIKDGNEWKWSSFDGKDVVDASTDVQSGLFLENVDINGDGSNEVLITINSNRLLDGSEITTTNIDKAGNISKETLKTATEDDYLSSIYQPEQAYSGDVIASPFVNSAFVNDVSEYLFLHSDGSLSSTSENGYFTVSTIETTDAEGKKVTDGYDIILAQDKSPADDFAVEPNTWKYKMVGVDTDANQVFIDDLILTEII